MKTVPITHTFAWVRTDLLTGLILLLLLCNGETVLGQTELDSAKAVRSINGKWWNHDESSYNSPTANPTYDNPIRKDGRLGQSTTSKNRFSRIDLSWLGEFLSFVIISILIVLLAAGLVLIGMHIAKTYRPLREITPSSEIKIDPTRIDDLPFEAVQWVRDPLAEARKLAQQGLFDQAIIYLYGYQLLALDQSRKIHLHKGKTNRMYLREIEAIEQLKEIVNLTMGKFEEVYFGKHSLTKQSFLEVWNKLDSFHSLIAMSTSQNVAGSTPTAVGAAV